jgi:hypothetical protein
MENNSRIIITRSSQWIDRHSVYRFFVDGVEVGTIGSSSPLYFITTPGIHKLQCRFRFFSSPELKLNIKPGEIIYLRTGNMFGRIVPIYLLVMAVFVITIIFQKKLPQDWIDRFRVGAYSFFIVSTLLPYFFRKKYLSLEEDKKNEEKK